MVTQAERSEKTIKTLLDAAEKLFGSKGYRGTTLDDVLAKAGLAKGALYHHFPNKQALFEAVLERVSLRVADHIQSNLVSETDILLALRKGVRQFFEQCAFAPTSQILLVDGPSVIGWERWRQIDFQNFGGTVVAALHVGMEQGVFRKRPVDPLAHLLIGAISEAALSCVSQNSFEESAESYIDGLDVLLLGLLKQPKI